MEGMTVFAISAIEIICEMELPKHRDQFKYGFKLKGKLPFRGFNGSRKDNFKLVDVKQKCDVMGPVSFSSAFCRLLKVTIESERRTLLTRIYKCLFEIYQA